MRSTSHLPALLALATVLLSGIRSEGAFVIYREIFPNDTTDNIFSVTAKPETGWTVHLGSSGAEQPVTNDGSTWHISRDALDTSATAAIAVNSNPQRVPLGNRGYLWQGTGTTNAPQILWTNEYTVNRSSWEVTEINWWQRNGATTTPIRVALQIDGNWYASAEDFGGTTSAVARSLDFATADWLSLNFAPGSALALGSAATLPGTGDISAFGWFTESRTNTLRLDSFEVRAESTAPVTNRLISSLVPNSTYPGIALWLDASDIHPNPADGTTVASWTDKVNPLSAFPESGSGTVTYQATVAGLGGQPAVELDQREMAIPDASLQTALNPGTEPFTVFAVGASHTAGDNDSMWVRKGNSGSANAGWSVMAGNQGAAVRANDEGGSAIGDRTSQRNPDLALNQFGVVTLNLSGIDPGTSQGVLTGRLNGTNTGWSFGGIGPSANHTYYDASITTNNLLTLGRTDAKSTLAEVLVYPGGLTPVQTLMVERYLGAKYGIPLNYDGPEQVLYQETFDNTTGSDQPLSAAGWKIHWGNGEQIPDHPAGGAVLSYVGFAIDISNKAGDLLYWTEEFSFNLDSHVVTRVTWDNNANESTAVRFAMQIDDDWYVSDDSFAKGSADLDFLNTTWQPLLFEPGSQLERPGTTTGLSILELGGTRVTAFGLYDDYGVRHRFDNVTIYAAIPEPSTALLALTGLAVLGLLRRCRTFGPKR